MSSSTTEQTTTAPVGPTGPIETDKTSETTQIANTQDTTMPKTTTKTQKTARSPQADKTPKVQAAAKTPKPAKETKETKAPEAAVAAAPSQAAALAKLAGTLPTTLLPLSQLEPHPENDEFRLYPPEALVQLGEIIESRPEDVPANPLQVVPTDKTNAEGQPLYHVISGNHRLMIYKEKGFEAAPVIIRENLSPVEQLLVMMTANRGRSSSQLEIGRHYRLYVKHCGGEQDHPGEPRPGEEGLATRVNYARAIGMDSSYISYCVDAADMYDSFSPATQHLISLAGDKFNGRHFRALKKVKGSVRERFAAWAVAGAPDKVVGSESLLQAIQLYKKETTTDQFVQNSIGDVVTDRAKATPLPQNTAAGGTTEKAGGTIAVGPGSRQGKVTADAAGGDTVNEGAYQKATAAVADPTTIGQDERLMQAKVYLETTLGPCAKSLYNLVKNRLAGPHLRTAQELLIGFYESELKACRDLPLRLALDEGGEGDEDGDAADGDDNSNTAASSGNGDGTAAGAVTASKTQAAVTA